MKKQIMAKRVLCIFVYLSVPSIVSVPAALPQVKGAVVQTWHYDPQQKAVVLRLVNVSNKDVTAYSISITLTYADGGSDYTDGRPNSPGGYMEDLLGGLLHPQANGNGAFAAGTIRDVILPQAKAISNVAAFVDLVVYGDSTAESTNDLMLKEICALRSGSLLAMQHTNEIIKRVLADPTVTSPIAEVVKELSAELAKVGPASALRRCGIVAWIRYDVRALAVWNMNVEAEARIRCWRNIDLCHFCCPSFDNVLA